MSKKWFKRYYKSSKEGYIIGAVYSTQVQEYAEDTYGRELTDEEMEQVFYLLWEDRVWDAFVVGAEAVDIVMGKASLPDHDTSGFSEDELQPATIEQLREPLDPEVQKLLDKESSRS